ncbi:hypothetical protein ACFFYR_16120 [Paraburkholderia dipogonis]|uniref:hypothetical protein n=1 Tax=Paraburkholderia dipogonis TaxID=1211383 RepID=UPI0035E58808
MLELFYYVGLCGSRILVVPRRPFRRRRRVPLGGLAQARCPLKSEVLGKGNRRPRRARSAARRLEALGAWLAVRDQMVKHDPHPLFLSRRAGNRLSPNVACASA